MGSRHKNGRAPQVVVFQRTILTVPSQELEMKVSFVTGFQAAAKASRLCSWKIMTGNSFAPMSKSLREPSPHATTSWFSLISDQAKSYIASLVSKLRSSPLVSTQANHSSPGDALMNAPRESVICKEAKHTSSQLECPAPSAQAQRVFRCRRCQSWRRFRRRCGSRGMASI